MLLLLKQALKYKGIGNRFVIGLFIISCSNKIVSIPFVNVTVPDRVNIPKLIYAYYLKKHSAALGNDDAEAWRTELVHQTLTILGVKKSQSVPVKKLSHAASQELQAHGYCTASGIWLYHTPLMSREMAYYIAVHESVHYALKHPQQLYCINTLVERGPIISSCFGALLGTISRTFFQSPSTVKTASVIIASSLFLHSVATFHAKHAKVDAHAAFEKEADTKACSLLIQQGKEDILNYIASQSQVRAQLVPKLAEQSAAYTTQLYKQYNLDPVWLASIHTSTIKEFTNTPVPTPK